MAKRYVSPIAVCPFYCSESPQKVFCEGVEQGSSIHLAFGDSKQLRMYMRRYCKGDYRKCLVARTLLQKYDEE